MGFRILGAASAASTYSLDQGILAEYAAVRSCSSEKEARLLSVLYRRTGVKTRGTVLLDESEGRVSDAFFHVPGDPADPGPSTRERMQKYERFAGEMAVRASRRALERGGVDAGANTHLITVSCTGFWAPGMDCDIITRLGLDPGVERSQLGFMGCQATLNAIRVARAFVDADPSRKVLIASVELCSLHFQYGWDPERVVTNALFAYGAGALVGGHAAPGEPEAPSWIATANGSHLVPESAQAMTWRIGDHGFDMTLSAQVPDLIEANLGGWLDAWLDRCGLGRKDIRSWAIHPGGIRILTAAEKALSLSPEATAVSRDVLARHGNMSSATMVFLLERLMEDERGLPCVALGFGPGLSIEAALFV
jgi:predicted naringenin-chalcone synthase